MIMKFLSYLQFVLLVIFASCSSNNSTTKIEEPADDKTQLELKDCMVKVADDKLEIATWNIEHFPKTGNTTKELASIIKKMNVDLIAIQEVTSKEKLDALDKLLPDYKAVIMTTQNIHLACLYKKSEIVINENPYKILKDKTYEFAGRTPYVLPIHSNATNLDILLINNHFKATTHRDDTPKKIKETIKRRRKSCQLLKQWIDENHSKDNVIVLGDLNDEITDEKAENVFQVFLDDTENYHFADRKLALPKNKQYWSYPSFPSHIDHILITNELFDNEDTTYTYTFQECDEGYDALISDHQPVCLVLKK